jgi:hypothetical protein
VSEDVLRRYELATEVQREGGPLIVSPCLLNLEIRFRLTATGPAAV